MMKLQEYARYDGLGLAELVASKYIDQTALKTLAQEAIAALNPALNFLAHAVTNDQQQVHDAAQNAPFLGVPTLLKDAAMKGQPLELGSRFNNGLVAPADDEFTRRFKRSGVQILGYSTMPEWGSLPTTESKLHGITRNPWHLQRIAGGSSGGAAAAVAAGVVPFAHASDAGGSIRIPAACCGVVGLKPSRGRTPGAQFVPFSPGCGHVITRTVRDTAAMLDCLHGNEVGAIYYLAKPDIQFYNAFKTRSQPRRIAFSHKSPSGGVVHKDNVDAVMATVRELESRGHYCEPCDLEVDWHAFVCAFTDLWAHRHPNLVNQIASITGNLPNEHSREYFSLLLHEHAVKQSVQDFDASLQVLARMCMQAGEFFRHFDAYVTPVLSGPVPGIGFLSDGNEDLSLQQWVHKACSQVAPFTPLFNVTGQPAISLPLHQSSSGMPVGVQIVANTGDETTLLQLAAQLEQAMPWQHRVPAVSLFN